MLSPPVKISLLTQLLDQVLSIVQLLSPDMLGNVRRYLVLQRSLKLTSEKIFVDKCPYFRWRAETTSK